MKSKKFFTLILVGIAFGSCSKSSGPRPEASEVMMAEEKAAASPSDYVSSSAAVENPQDTTHQFIRTANLKFKVKDVVQSTYDIEDITNKQGGFVTYTNLTSEVDRVNTVNISADSSLISTYYTVVNSLTLRVPNIRLDTALKEIARNIDFLDYRIIQAQDVALQILANSLSQKRLAKNEERLANAIDRQGRRLNETASAEELLLNKQEQADNAKIANLALSDQISFSTVSLSIYQKQSVKRELVFNEKNSTAYQPSWGRQFLESLRWGWNLLADLVIFITKFWAFIVLGVVAYLAYRKYGHKIRKKEN
ncbi:MAG: DUF4349 domain-containing protein [Candidatus Azobacteroides sp.]|nr:DUF4349 domain-containing protein [Candidatus Azobacteroides sp.]